MRRFYKIIPLLFSPLIITGCSSTPTIHKPSFYSYKHLVNENEFTANYAMLSAKLTARLIDKKTSGTGSSKTTYKEFSRKVKIDFRSSGLVEYKYNSESLSAYVDEYSYLHVDPNNGAMYRKEDSKAYYVYSGTGTSSQTESESEIEVLPRDYVRSVSEYYGFISVGGKVMISDADTREPQEYSSKSFYSYISSSIGLGSYNIIEYSTPSLYSNTNCYVDDDVLTMVTYETYGTMIVQYVYRNNQLQVKCKLATKNDESLKSELYYDFTLSETSNSLTYPY